MNANKQDIARMLAEDRKFGEKVKHGHQKGNKSAVVHKKHNMDFKRMNPQDVVAMGDDWED